jgi:hypothetical protein
LPIRRRIRGGRSRRQAVGKRVPTLKVANGIVHIAKFFDPRLVNPSGSGGSSTSFVWISDNGAGGSTLYNTAGMAQSLVVSIPAPGHPLGTGGAPTGVVFSTDGGASGGFTVSGLTRGGLRTSQSVVFLFATEDEQFWAGILWSTPRALIRRRPAPMASSSSPRPTRIQRTHHRHR